MLGVVRRPVRIEPGPGQESVWDYPRPPVVEPVADRIRVVVDGIVVADSTRALRVLETSQPPAYYVPIEDVDGDRLRPSPTRTFCEWKGQASYWSVVTDRRTVVDAAWSYPAPTARFASLAGSLAFYAQKADECWVGADRVRANEGSFYGGWITDRIVGPFKGGAGTGWW
jgi:uncharacterized protein (DUF427 family)